MNPNEDRLTVLLKQWRDTEPRTSFEADVWRKIRLAEVVQPKRAHIGEILRDWLRQPAYVSTFAVALGLAFGLWMGALSAPQPQTYASVPFQFLGHDTLAGSYAELAGEKSP